MIRRLPVLVLLLAGCGSPPPPAAPPPEPFTPHSIGHHHLHNLFKLNDRFYSGSSPEGDAGFAALRALGVKTVISVDGAAPDVALAGKYGLRYVHLPVGYDGVPRDKALVLAKAVRDLPGPVYVHCHHGKHRGPAAAMCAVVALDPSVTPEQAAEWLKTAGTDPRYRGLIELPKTFTRPTAAELDAVPSDFPNTVAVPGLTKLMVQVDARWDRINEHKDAGWKSPDAAGEVVQLAELYREAARLPESAKMGEEFVKLLREAESAAGELEGAKDVVSRNASFQRSQAACGKCHTKYRDTAP